MGKTKTNRIEKAIQTIEKRFEIGKKILKTCGPTSPHGLIEELAEQHKINRDVAQKLRAIASRERGYTKTELKQWFKLFREEGHALTISHFVKLISLPKGKRRDRLTREAVKNRWSTHRLQAEILSRQGRRKQGGRRPTVIAGKGFEAELERTLWTWDRWLELHLEANPQVRPEIAKELKAIKRKIVKVNELLMQRSDGD